MHGRSDIDTSPQASHHTLGAGANQAAAGNHTHAGGGAAVGARAYLTAAASVSSGVETVVSLDSEDFDTDGFHSLVTNTSRLTIPVGLAGIYVVSASIGFGANSAGIRTTHIYKNGATEIAAIQIGPAPSASVSTVLPVVWIGQLADGDYVEIKAEQNSGSTLSLLAVDRATSLSLVRFGS